MSIEVTRRCPLECLHCYNNLPMSDHAARAQELTFDEHVHLLDELVDAGTLWLLYTAAKSSRARISSKFITTSPPGTGIRNTLSSSFASRLTSFGNRAEILSDRARSATSPPQRQQRGRRMVPEQSD